MRRARATVSSVDLSSTRISSSTQSRGMAEIVFSSVRAALRAGMTTTTLASALASGMARQDMDVATFLRRRTRARRRLQGVKEWRPIQEDAGLRGLADELGAARAPHFTRRPREAPTPEDERLAARAIREAEAGDSEAIRYLYLRYADNVYGYVRSIVRDPHEAEDLTQHVFAKLMVA